jgi:hypothetical protein
MKEGEMGGTRSTYRGEAIPKGFWKPEKRDYVEDLDVVGRVIFKWLLKK